MMNEELKIDESVIPKLVEDFKTILANDKTRTFEDGVALGYNIAMRMCKGEISRLRSCLKNAEEIVGGFYSPPTSNVIPTSFGTPYIIKPLTL